MRPLNVLHRTPSVLDDPLQIRAMLSREEKRDSPSHSSRLRTVLRLCESSVRVSALARQDDIDAALADHGAERLAYGQRVVRRGRHLGAYMQAQTASEEEQRQAQHFRQPEVVMTETASMHGLENW